MLWCAAGFEKAVEDLTALLRGTAWPGPPPGFERVTPARRMRTVLRGTLEGPEGPVAVVLKWNRPDSVADHVSKRVRGGKGPREGRVLRVLEAQGVGAPRPLAFGDEGADLLVTEELPGLRPAPNADRATRAEIAAVAELVARAHAAGLRHRDLHAGNVGFVGEQPLLVDLGGARVGAAPSGRDLVRTLAHLRHGLLGRARRSQRLRALFAYMRATRGAFGREVARDVANASERAADRVARRYRRGRDRRATRDGRHFVTYRGAGATRGIRWRGGTDASWEPLTSTWLAGDIEQAVPLKAGGDVLGTEIAGQRVVAKRFGPSLKGRLPRPLRAFRRAWALEHRHVAVPRALAATAGADGGGLCVSAWIDAPNLHAFSGGGRAGDLAALSTMRRHRSLECLGRALRALHDAHVSHRDLKAPNLLARPTKRGFEIFFADLEGVRIRRRRVPWARRARDLARLDASLDALATDRLRVLHAYMRVLPQPPVTLREMAERIAEHVRRKRGPTGLPR